LFGNNFLHQHGFIVAQTFLELHAFIAVELPEYITRPVT
jgi:hypothetical protein